MSTGAPNPRAEVAAEGLTGSIADGKATDGREALRGDLTRLIDEVGLTPFEIEEWKLDELAGRLLTAGRRRVVEDDDTIAKFAVVLAKEDGVLLELAHLTLPQHERTLYANKFWFAARAVVRALREET